MAREPIEIHVRGRLDDAQQTALTESYVLETVETVLKGDVADQAELHGLLTRLQDLGCSIVAVRRPGY